MLSVTGGMWYFSVQPSAAVCIVTSVCGNWCRWVKQNAISRYFVQKDSMEWTGECGGDAHHLSSMRSCRCQDFLKKISMVREVLWRRLSKSGVHHLADLGKHFIWWPLGINLWMESEVSSKSRWVHIPRASTDQNTILLWSGLSLQVVKIH